MKYYLIHICASSEFLTPVIVSQVFEQAYFQKTQLGLNKPEDVEVWVPVSLKQFLSKDFRVRKAQLKERFTGLKIRLIPGIDRWNHYPRAFLLKLLQGFYGRLPIVYHFRGTALLKEFAKAGLNKGRNRFIADVRGIWPAEFLLNKGIEVYDVIELARYPDSQMILERTREELNAADAVCAVSKKLLHWSLSLSPHQKGWVVPCAASLMPLENRESVLHLKQAMKIPLEAKVIVYMGSTAVYQNLPELVIPLMKEISLLSDEYHLLFMTQEDQKMKSLLLNEGMDLSRVSIVSVDQKEVRKYLAIADLGILVRKANLVNQMAQPVKMSEYLAAGVPVCVESGLSDLSQLLSAYAGGIDVNIRQDGIQKAAKDCHAFLRQGNKADRGRNARKLAEACFSWESQIMIHRAQYIKTLET